MAKALILFSLLIPSILWGSECIIKNLRALDKSSGANPQIQLGNTERNVWVDASLERKINYFKSTDKKIDIITQGLDCQSLHEISNLALPASSIQDIVESRGEYECLDCLTFSQVPLHFHIPSYKGFEKALLETTLSADKITSILYDLVQSLEKLNPRTKVSNSFLISVLFLKRLSDAGLEAVSSNELEQMFPIIAESLSSYESETFKNIVSRMDRIEIHKIGHNKSQFVFFTKNGKEINIDDSIIKKNPNTKTTSTSAIDKFVIRNSAMMTVSEEKLLQGLSIFDVEFSGLDGYGKFNSLVTIKAALKKAEINKKDSPLKIRLMTGLSFFTVVPYDLKINY